MLTVLRFVRDTVTDFVVDRAMQYAAALSFYAAFSLAPLLVMVLTVMAQILDGPQARLFVLEQIALQLGQPVAEAVDGMIARAAIDQPRGLAAAIATVAMLIGATAVIMSMKAALDHVFGSVEHESARDLWISLVVARFKAFAMVVVLSLMLGASLLAAAVAGGLVSAIGDGLPDWVDVAGWSNTAFSIVVFWTLVFICYRFFPDRPPGWRPALWGALVTTLLFTAGQKAIAWYVTTVGTASAFGAAGALAVFLVWIYASAMCFLLGAECAKNFARRQALG